MNRTKRACIGWTASACVLCATATLPADWAWAATWGAETNLSLSASDSETGLGHRPVVFDAAGTLHVVWAEKDAPNQNYRIYARSSALAGGAWDSAELLVDYLASDPGTGVGAKYPSLAPAPNGDLHLFWHDYRIAGIDNIEIFTKLRAAGSAWDPSRDSDVRLTTTDHPETNGDNGYVPTPAVAPNGTIHVLWYDFRYDGNAGEILTKSRAAGGSWNLTPGDSADTRITNDADHSELAAAAVDALGNVHVAWRSAGGGAHVRYARRDATTGAWSPSVDVDLAGQVVGAPAIGVDLDARAHVVWPDSRDGGRALFTRVRETNGAWSPAARITRPADAADEPSLIAGADGALHLVWHDARVSFFNREVFHRAKPPGAPWDSTGATDTRISNASGSSTRPSVAVRGGTIAVLWKDARTGNNEIFVRVATDPATVSPDIAQHKPASQLDASPNPTRGESVRLSRGGPGVLGAIEIADVRGRCVRRIDAAASTASWNLCDDAGAPVAAGVYYARLAGSREVRPITVLR
jgi:hypothetical protein